MSTSSKQDASGARSEPESLKETLISIIIAFALAFVGRSYVVEPFVIPTGSMAPTLNGAHMRFSSPASGFDWAVNPRDSAAGRLDVPLRIQGDRRSNRPIEVSDPVTGVELSRFNVPLRAGDRILVLKYLYAIFEPTRFDVVVFKNPERPQENYIKRLVGMPHEEIWLCDGDLFVRQPDSKSPELQKWRVQRKPRRIQESVWWPLFSSEYRPQDKSLLGRAWRSPWAGEGWDTSERTYRSESPDSSPLAWDWSVKPITDYTPYNEPVERSRGAFAHFPVSDVRVRAGVQPDHDDVNATATLRARQHEFQAEISNNGVSLRMRRAGDESWTTLATNDFGGFKAGAVTNLEFIHVDQSLELRANGRRVAYAEYEWTPLERLTWATNDRANLDRGLPLADPDSYRRPEISWSFSGSRVTLHRVGLDRDLYWRTDSGQGGDGYARATSPGSTVTLEKDQFFMLGDNSSASSDSRLWHYVDAWVAAEIDDRVGIVPRELMMGKAFFVYFPAPHANLSPIPVPDFGRLRFIK